MSDQADHAFERGAQNKTRRYVARPMRQQKDPGKDKNCPRRPGKGALRSGKIAGS